VPQWDVRDSLQVRSSMIGQKDDPQPGDPHAQEHAKTLRLHPEQLHGSQLLYGSQPRESHESNVLPLSCALVVLQSSHAIFLRQHDFCGF
jgi:hypothetical protein